MCVLLGFEQFTLIHPRAALRVNCAAVDEAFKMRSMCMQLVYIYVLNILCDSHRVRK